mmetsp:Transcript_89927/g.124922  ORF Transcript_89927/g.124922 Transcript_89927/m.124922 type:complete len:200 (-) Transcript_89927:336-935(-)
MVVLPTSPITATVSSEKSTAVKDWIWNSTADTEVKSTDELNSVKSTTKSWMTLPPATWTVTLSQTLPVEQMVISNSVARSDSALKTMPKPSVKSSPPRPTADSRASLPSTPSHWMVVTPEAFGGVEIVKRPLEVPAERIWLPSPSVATRMTSRSVPSTSAPESKEVCWISGGAPPGGVMTRRATVVVVKSSMRIFSSKS